MYIWQVNIRKILTICIYWLKLTWFCNSRGFFEITILVPSPYQDWELFLLMGPVTERRRKSLFVSCCSSHLICYCSARRTAPDLRFAFFVWGCTLGFITALGCRSTWKEVGKGQTSLNLTERLALQLPVVRLSPCDGRCGLCSSCQPHYTSSRRHSCPTFLAYVWPRWKDSFYWLFAFSESCVHFESISVWFRTLKCFFSKLL